MLGHPEAKAEPENARYPARLVETEMSQTLSLTFTASEIALRTALAQVIRFLQEGGFSKDFQGVVELVLAEIINNITEHAYAGRQDGQVDLRIRTRSDTVLFTIYDLGAPMPGGEAPSGKPQDLDCALQDLPEGGFGWFLIRELTEDLFFTRIEKQNRLTFSMNPARFAH